MVMMKMFNIYFTKWMKNLSKFHLKYLKILNVTLLCTVSIFLTLIKSYNYHIIYFFKTYQYKFLVNADVAIQTANDLKKIGFLQNENLKKISVGLTWEMLLE